MTDIAPMPFTWSGEAMVPKRPKLADAYYVIGEDYTLVEHEESSTRSRNHYFASVHDAWLNLSDADTARWPSDDHLRKYALIRTGFRDERSIPLASRAEALRVAAFMRPMDEYAVILVQETVVTVYTAKTQKRAAMGAEKFQASKTAVLDFLAAMLGTTTQALAQNAETVA